MKKQFFVWALIGAAAFGAQGAMGQDKVPSGSFALVNSTPLSNQLFEQVLRNNAAQGVKDTPELRNIIKTELVGRAALSQEAARLGLDKLESSQAQLELLRQNFLAEALLVDHANKNPIDDAAIRAEYDRQVVLLKDSKEYHIRDIVLADEASAKAVMASLRKGDSFDRLAREKSVDASKSIGGDLGWLLAEQINPLIANVVVNLSKGALAAAPIQAQNGWHIIKLEDVRNFKPPKFEDSKAQIRQGLQIKQRTDFVNKIMGAARIQAAE